jgi:hypothetical protein
MASTPRRLRAVPSELSDSPYAVCTVQELKSMLAARGLPRTGNKADMLTRLDQNDTV